MVLWCKCGAFMGLREPLDDWSVDRTGMCPVCAKKEFDANALVTRGLQVEIPALEVEAPEAS
jgi:hypothetical protein